MKNIRLFLASIDYTLDTISPVVAVKVYDRQYGLEGNGLDVHAECSLVCHNRKRINS